ncbi:hypothetical protein BACSTE_02913 [Bacteroides stercoris ATCC 43183]|uniref:Uncharacterized protein n=1 Tax=Bacteroides stercoris ATCC 43183 TaxID=449673 RepID=B0NTS9_BACSE|nr:hypothetical protein BACSTE_02913 [Bacteroides stercoris ATCC 43183]
MYFKDRMVSDRSPDTSSFFFLFQENRSCRIALKRFSLFNYLIINKMQINNLCYVNR